MVFEFDLYDIVLVSTLVDAELKRCKPCQCQYAAKGNCFGCDYHKQLVSLLNKMKYKK